MVPSVMPHACNKHRIKHCNRQCLNCRCLNATDGTDELTETTGYVMHACLRKQRAQGGCKIRCIGASIRAMHRPPIGVIHRPSDPEEHR